MSEPKVDISGEQILEALGDLASYNGHEEEIKQVIDYIKSDNNEYVIKFPDFLSCYDCDSFIRTLWSMTVLIYGDYGTSPRFGWLESENKEKILAMWEYIYLIAK